ncbi:MAG: hypothetical protein APG12_01065 [Candidatus Methanofastidiosum methylothiophilum]|uniref:Uncharacterized protein n=1 Tax=Candidatus Methanofastidiosum methylothiophilum TaxID=1705564 RepID=A0A150ISI0_9EURY|nr:MAG: hypothetical protein APG10_00608 [Candidatus Methanofastidiosum methylthiophilus]KYC47903.1 MAG: hypothetical protein APG11_00782 [Candidatus Methanofastidiosum methylthiophilus]KYC50072.1 MAG: hypothetical protein APG12_01065 [Candidatus Methanofastidiosum methylthiophilus]
MSREEKLKNLVEQGKQILEIREGEFVNKGAFAAWRSNVYSFLNDEFSIEEALAFTNICENNNYRTVQNAIYFLEHLDFD